MLKAVRSALLCLLLTAASSRAADFYHDVRPILQQHCQGCHRPGDIGPMPLLTYEQARPWAKAIRSSVVNRKMPPWFADPRFGQFSNDPSLTPGEIATIVSWVVAGSPAGDKLDAPPVVTRSLPHPDLVMRMPKPFPIPAHARIEYQYILFHPNITKDTWVKAVEIRPGDRSVIHHAVLYVREPGSKWLEPLKPGLMYGLDNPGVLEASKAAIADILAIYTPGAPVMLCPQGMARKIPAGSDLVLQMHYTSKAQDASDQTEIALVTTPDPPKQRLMTLQMANYDIRLEPGKRDQRFTVAGSLPQDATLVSLFPHMHLRGSGFEFQIVGGQGRVETLLKVNDYDFYWQLQYRLKTPRFLPAGTRLLWTGYFDNSSENPHNPDPDAEVTWGGQSDEEMMVGFFDVAVPPDVDKPSFFMRKLQ